MIRILAFDIRIQSTILFRTTAYPVSQAVWLTGYAVVLNRKLILGFSPIQIFPPVATYENRKDVLTLRLRVARVMNFIIAARLLLPSKRTMKESRMHDTAIHNTTLAHKAKG